MSEKFEQFLADPRIAKMVQGNIEYYRKKWMLLFIKSGSVANMDRKVSWNWAAFFLGYFWLFYRKMWGMAFALSGVALLIVSIDVIFKKNFQVSLIGISTYLGMFGNGMYFKNIYKKLKNISAQELSPGIYEARILSVGGTSLGAAISAAIVILFLSIMVAFAGEEGAKPNKLADVSAVWRSEVNEMVIVDFRNENRFVLINGKKIPVTIQSIDYDNDIINFSVMKKNSVVVTWSLRQIWDADKAKFTISITTDEGSSFKLGFVRRIQPNDI